MTHPWSRNVKWNFMSGKIICYIRLNFNFNKYIYKYWHFLKQVTCSKPIWRCHTDAKNNLFFNGLFKNVFPEKCFWFKKTILVWLFIWVILFISKLCLVNFLKKIISESQITKKGTFVNTFFLFLLINMKNI